MNRTRNAWGLLPAIALVMALLSACATQLAPLYDQAVTDGLNTANADAMALFAEASGGTSKDSFAQRESKYDRAIGEYDALALQAAARPVPTNDIAEAIKKIVGARNTPGDKDQVIPSTTAMQGLSDTLSKMKEVDHKQGVTAMEVMAFRGQALIYMDQALTYEAALKR